MFVQQMSRNTAVFSLFDHILVFLLFLRACFHSSRFKFIDLKVEHHTEGDRGKIFHPCHRLRQPGLWPGALSGFPTWVAEAQTLGASSVAFPGL